MASRAADKPAKAPKRRIVRVLPRDRQREETRARVRASAVDVIRRDGLAAARIEDIARAAGVSRGAFYFHFPTKDDVLLEVLADAEARIALVLAGMPRLSSLRDVLEALCTAVALEWRAEPRLFPEVGRVALRRAASEGASTPPPDGIRSALCSLFERSAIRGELAEVLPPPVLADTFLMSLFGATMAWCRRAHAHPPLEMVLGSVADVFLAGAVRS